MIYNNHKSIKGQFSICYVDQPEGIFPEAHQKYYVEL